MQVPELYRRGVVRPLDDSAARQLALFWVEIPIRTELIPVLNDNQFGDLWKTGIFQRINEACGIEISDYEEVELSFQQLAAALNVIRNTENLNGSAAAFFKSLDSMLVEAIECRRNVYFIF